jgi:hypothetical protein
MHIRQRRTGSMWNYSVIDFFQFQQPRTDQMINFLTGLKLLLFAMQYIFNELGHMPANSNTDLFTFIYSISSSRTTPSLCTPFKTPSSVHRSPLTTNPGPNKRSWSPKGLIHTKVRTSRCLARYISQARTPLLSSSRDHSKLIHVRGIPLAPHLSSHLQDEAYPRTYRPGKCVFP